MKKILGPATIVGRRRKFLISIRLKGLEELNICRRRVMQISIINRCLLRNYLESLLKVFGGFTFRFEALRPQFVDILFIVRLKPNMSMRCAVINYFLVHKIEVENRQLTFCVKSNHGGIKEKETQL